MRLRMSTLVLVIPPVAFVLVTDYQGMGILMAAFTGFGAMIFTGWIQLRTIPRVERKTDEIKVTATKTEALVNSWSDRQDAKNKELEAKNATLEGKIDALVAAAHAASEKREDAANMRAAAATGSAVPPNIAAPAVPEEEIKVATRTERKEK